MSPTELRNALKKGIEILKVNALKKDVVKFKGVYSNYFMQTDEDGFICLCAEQYGYLTKVNPKRNTSKIARLFYVDMTEKVCQ